MSEAIELVEQIINEHTLISGGVRNVEKAVNDVKIMAAFGETGDKTASSRLDQSEELQKLRDGLQELLSRVRDHFNREETILLTVFREHGDEKIMQTFQSLLTDHEQLRNQLSYCKLHLGKMTDTELSHERRSKASRDLQEEIDKTRSMLERHAGREQMLFNVLLDELKNK